MPIRITRGIKFLLLFYLGFFFLQQTGDRFFGTHFWGVFALIPSRFFGSYNYWQLFTYSFLHGDVFQLFFNGLLLAFIGAELELALGTVKFLKYYAFCCISSGILYLILSLFFQFNAPLSGPGGGIYGLLMAYGLLFGERVLLFMLLFPLKAKHFIWVLAFLELLTSIYSAGGNLSSLVSIAGMLAGLSYLWVQSLARQWKTAAKNKKKVLQNINRLKRMRSNHLKLIVNNDDDLLDSPDDTDPPKTWH